jgi:hypothetical protein
MTRSEYEKALRINPELHVLAVHNELKDADGDAVHTKFPKRFWESIATRSPQWKKVETNIPEPVESAKVAEAEPKKVIRKRTTKKS